MVGAAALLTTTGGVASHAAVVARGWGIPAVTGMASASVQPDGIRIGDVFIPGGETVTVDGTTGAFYRGDCRSQDAPEADAARTLRQWAAELGIEPGTSVAVAATTQSAPAGREITLLEVARTIQLKGLCTVERAAAALGAAESDVTGLVESAPDRFRATPRGLMVTPDGRAWVEAALATEREGGDAAALTAAYERFTALNHRFKQLVNDWQQANSSANTEALQPLLDALASLHGDFAPLLSEIAEASPRLASYTPRFAAALRQLRAGDHSMLASPLKDSYHTVWFEYHEELISLCSRDRLAEERAET